MMHIQQIEYQLGPSVEIEALNDRYQMSANQLQVYQKLYQLRQVSVMPPSFVEMIAKPLARTLTQIEPRQVAYIVFCHSAFAVNVWGQNVIRSLQQQFNLAHVMCFAMTDLKCMAPMQALTTVNTLLQDRPHQYGLVITFDQCFTEVTYQIHGATLNGDGVSIVTLASPQTPDPAGRVTIEHQVVDKYGQYAAGNWLGAQQQQQLDADFTHYMYHALEQILAARQLCLADMSTFIVPHINYVLYRKFAKQFGLDLQQFYLDNLSHMGHCHGADVWINLKRWLVSHPTAHDQLLILLGMGLGGYFGAALVRIAAQPTDAVRS